MGVNGRGRKLHAGSNSPVRKMMLVILICIITLLSEKADTVCINRS